MIKYFWKIVLIYLAVGVITVTLCMVSFSKSLKKDLGEIVQNAASRALAEFSSIENVTSDSIGEFIYETKDTYTIVAGLTEDVYIYEISDDYVYGFSENEFPDAVDPSLPELQYISGYIYVPVVSDLDAIFWFVSSSAYIDTVLMNAIRGYMFIFPISFVVLCILTLIVLLLSKKFKKIFRTIYVFVFLWTLPLFFLISTLSWIVRINFDYSAESRILDSLSLSVDLVKAAPDDELSYYLVGYSEEELSSARSKANGDERLAILYLSLDHDRQFYKTNTIYTLKDNIWDADLPIGERVHSDYDYEALCLKLLDAFLISLMLGVVAALLVHEVLSYDKREKEKNAAKIVPVDPNLFHNADRMKLILTIKGFSDTLTVVLTASMLKRFFVKDFGSYNATMGSVIMIIAGLLGCAAILIIPKLMKKAGNVRAYLHLTLFLCCVGSLICFLSGHLVEFVIGFFIISLSAGFMRMVTIMFTMSHPDMRDGLYFLSCLTRAPVTGQIVGAVIGAILATIMDNIYMYLISAVCSFGLILLSMTLKRENMNNKLPDRLGLKEMVRNKDILFFFAMVMIPFGFQNYFFSYSIPLDAAALGLTTVVVSFIYFLRNLFKLYFKSRGLGKQFWRKMPLRTSSVLCLILTAVMFLIYLIFHGVWTLIFIGITLAYIQAIMNSRIYAYNYALVNNDFDKTFGNSTVIVFGRYIGKTIAPAFVELLGIISLPIIMIVTSVSYLIVSRKK